MNNSFKQLALTLFVGTMILMPGTILAQHKFGHINSQEIVALMPERDSAMVNLAKYGKELTEQQQAMEQEFETKYNAYNEGRNTWSSAVLEMKEKELSDLQQRIYQFQQTANNDFSQRQQTLLAPIMQKAQAAIDKVGKEKGLLYIFDLSTGPVVYVDDIQSLNVLPLVKSELGIPASKTQPTQIDENGEIVK